MSREDRLSMRRKIKSLIIRYGIPAIWFTLNPNDIMNPVKLILAAYRGREPEEAEAFLASLDLMYKRVRLAISDPISSAIFFHREISMFFEHYVQTGNDSVFGRISQYYGAVETNERGALHVHGLLWLQGNMNLSSVLKDVVEDDQAAYRDAVIQYVDSVFAEVSLPKLKLSPIPYFCINYPIRKYMGVLESHHKSQRVSTSPKFPKSPSFLFFSMNGMKSPSQFRNFSIRMDCICGLPDDVDS